MAKEKKPLASIQPGEQVLGGSSKYINEKRRTSNLKPKQQTGEVAPYSYCNEVDKALGKEMSRHRTLRTCLDPFSQEWKDTSPEEKLQIMQKIIQSGTDINRLLKDYKKTYKAMNKMHVVYSLEDGLLAMLRIALQKDVRVKGA